MWVVNTLHSEPYQPGFARHEFSATAGKRFVYGTVFIAAKPHGRSPVTLKSGVVESEIGDWGAVLPEIGRLGEAPES
jgi:hypothetical protein